MTEKERERERETEEHDADADAASAINATFLCFFSYDAILSDSSRKRERETLHFLSALI